VEEKQGAPKTCYAHIAFDRPTWAGLNFLPRIARLQMYGDHLKKIFVGNLDFEAAENSISELFEPHGTVESVSLVTDRDTGRSRGFGFVQMTDSAAADRAIAALNGTNSAGRALNVSEARPKTRPWQRVALVTISADSS
jgi:hypothetical protein